MTPRTRYTIKLALRVNLGAWFTDEEGAYATAAKDDGLTPVEIKNRAA